MKFYIQQRIPFILEGPPGTGKSLAARYWSKDITGSEAIKIDITEDTELMHVLGDIDWKQLLAESHQVRESAPLWSPVHGGQTVDFTALYERYYVSSAAITAMREGRVLIEDINHAVQETTRVTRCGGKVAFIVPSLRNDECEDVFISHGYSKSTMETPCDGETLIFRKEVIE